MRFFISLLLCCIFVGTADAADESGEMLEWVKKGDAYLGQGRPLLALAEYEKARRAGAGSAPFLNRMAAIYICRRENTQKYWWFCAHRCAKNRGNSPFIPAFARRIWLWAISTQR